MASGRRGIYDVSLPGRDGVSRFTQPDTIIPNPTNGQDLNRYSYVVNNPVNLNDPTGHIYDRPDYSYYQETADWSLRVAAARDAGYYVTIDESFSDGSMDGLVAVAWNVDFGTSEAIGFEKLAWTRSSDRTSVFWNPNLFSGEGTGRSSLKDAFNGFVDVYNTYAPFLSVAAGIGCLAGVVAACVASLLLDAGSVGLNLTAAQTCEGENCAADHHAAAFLSAVSAGPSVAFPNSWTVSYGVLVDTIPTIGSIGVLTGAD